MSLSLKLLVSAIAQARMTTVLTSNLMLVVPAVLLSNVVFPVRDVPFILRLVSSVLPTH